MLLFMKKNEFLNLFKNVETIGNNQWKVSFSAPCRSQGIGDKNQVKLLVGITRRKVLRLMDIYSFDSEELNLKEILEKEGFRNLTPREQEIAMDFFYEGFSFGKEYFWVELDQKLHFNQRREHNNENG